MALLRPKNNSFWGKVPTYTVFYVIKKNPTCTPLRPTCLLISEKSATYTMKWSYTIIWQVRVDTIHTIRTETVSDSLHDVIFPPLCNFY